MSKMSKRRLFMMNQFIVKEGLFYFQENFSEARG